MTFIRSAFVVGRRDFVATVASKTFLLFLLGPLFPLAFGMVFGNLGERVAKDDNRTVVAIVAPEAEFHEIAAARTGSTCSSPAIRCPNSSASMPCAAMPTSTACSPTRTRTCARC